MSREEIVFSSAKALARRIRDREISAREVMIAHIEQIEQINPTVNAIVSMLNPEVAIERANEADRQPCEGPLHGLPTAFKDLEDAVGFPNTQGSPIFADRFPEEDAAIVARIKQAGAIPIGKTNVPEFGLGSHTYNNVFGPTRNPWNLERTAGGSSGGAAAALATGMLPIADGSDTGGSLRNPGNFNSVVGFRVSSGLVPKSPTALPWAHLGVKGPLGRSVDDVGFFLSAMAGFDPRDQISYPVDAAAFAGDLTIDPKHLRIAWSTDLGGLPVDPTVRSVVDGARAMFEAIGCDVEDACPDFTDADELFKDLRAFGMTPMADLMREHRDQMKPEAIWNIEAGLKMSAEDVARAMMKQATLFQRMSDFMERYDAFVCVVNQVPPFPIDLDWPHEIDGVQMETYIDWMKSAYYITSTRMPAISVPAGFTPDGLPVGIQIVGKYHGDLELLKIANAFEQATNVASKRPPIVS
ncbi:MAG TPA: amidase [Thermomicrobiales bacterium]|nr:amidase [Thermomicrobiales bacterium]